MYLIKRTNGIYYVEYVYQPGKRKRISTGSKDKIKAEDFLTKFKKNKTILPIQKTVDSVEPIKTVKEFFCEYKLYIESSKSKKYLKSVEKTIEFFQEKFGKLTFEVLLSRDIEKLLLVKYQVSKYSASAHFRNLRAAFNKGIEWNYLSKNPVSKIKLPKIPKIIPRFICEDELNE
jgi:hypothetical protein